MKIATYIMVILFSYLILFSSAVSAISSVGDVEIKLISPIGAIARSAIPGWGQFYTHNKFQGILVFLSVSALGGLGLRTDAEYRSYYKQYKESVYSGSDQSPYYYDKANDYYKLSQFFLYTAVGIWVYSAVDSYIEAHIYNARVQSSAIDVDSQRLQTIK
ncbi:MAG: DUF5683 domain-containing protein [Candidatus Poribacteria bacterium]